MNKYEHRQLNGVDDLFKQFKSPIIASVIAMIVFIFILDNQYSIVKPLEAQNLDQGPRLLRVSYVIVEPEIKIDNKDQFIVSMNRCITYLYRDLEVAEHLPRELIIAQAILESNYGKSRLAGVSNNLFGIRTWDKTQPHVFPLGVEQWPGWGVKVFETKCDSVAHYIRMINEVFAYEEFREVRAKILEHGEIPNGLDLAPTLTKYASRANYTELVATLIKYNIRGVYEL